MSRHDISLSDPLDLGLMVARWRLSTIQGSQPTLPALRTELRKIWNVLSLPTPPPSLLDSLKSLKAIKFYDLKLQNIPSVYALLVTPSTWPLGCKDPGVVTTS